MTEAIRETLRDSKAARWTALGILSFTMFAGYLFTEIISPIKPLLESTYGWTSSDFGTVVSAYGWFNVFFFALIFVGILLDKFGIRFSTLSSAGIMVVGALIKYYAFAGTFDPEATMFGMNLRVFYASIGYAIFGVGVEYAGITVSKSIVKWFKGKEMALAMGMQVAIARLGSFVPLAFGAKIAKEFSIPSYLLLGVVFLLIGLISFFIYNTMDRKLEKEDAESSEMDTDDEFKFSDLGVILTNKAFWYIAILCVLFYGAVFPFYKYGPDLMVNKFGVPDDWAGSIPSLVPFGTIFLTPFFGGIYDKKGKGANIMILGAVMLIVVHLIYYLPFITSVYVAIANAILLGIAFSLVPSAMWPSVPKIIPEKQLGSAYATIFYIQNWGLMGIPFLVGKVLDATNPQVVQAIKDLNSKLTAQGLTPDQIQVKITELKAAGEFPLYDYQQTWLIYVGLTFLALIFAFLLKMEDKKKGYGLQLPNIKS
jgi:predicted MFS family arabinose efflux permease